MIVGAVRIDFSEAFDVIDHNLLLKKRTRYGFFFYGVIYLPSHGWRVTYLTSDSFSYI
jgi:hypothetical protein